MSDYMKLGKCKIILPMRYEGNTVILNQNDKLMFTVRGNTILIEEVNVRDYDSYYILLNALVRYAYFIGIEIIHIYETLPQPTVDFLTAYGFVEEEFLQSDMIRTFTLYC